MHICQQLILGQVFIMQDILSYRLLQCPFLQNDVGLGEGRDSVLAKGHGILKKEMSQFLPGIKFRNLSWAITHMNPHVLGNKDERFLHASNCICEN